MYLIMLLFLLITRKEEWLESKKNKLKTREKEQMMKLLRTMVPRNHME